MAASLAAFERSRPAASNTVFKSGPLFISSKGIGWKSWKKRWFILTRTSLVFFKDDPSLLSQRGGEVNLTLGGIDLDGSGSVVVREDKKLLTVLFPHGQDGRAITFKAGTSEDLFEWKAALEHALARAPNAALVMGQNGILQNETDDTIEGSFHKWADKNPVTSLVVGRPILLALEDVDGGPSFLEKALQFLEKFGTKVEGILRQSADVEEVYHRIQEYEQGKIEFQSNEDANVVGDCVKYVLRELPSSPVPASCCTALLEAYKIDQKEARINAMRSAIIEMLPEPNSRLLHRVLKMMQTISMHAHENRMTPSAVAACMAPLLLRPLLAGECELENEYDMNGDSSAQLLAAANAANHAQAIITTLLEEFDTVFDDGNLQRCSISADSQMENSATEDSSGDESVIVKEDVYHDLEDYVDPEADDGSKLVKSEKMSVSSLSAGSDLFDCKAFGCDYSDVDSPSHVSVGISTVLTEPQSDKESSIRALKQHGQQKKEIESPGNEVNNPSLLPNTEPYHSIGEILSSMNSGHPLSMPGLKEGSGKTIGKISGSNIHAKRSPLWGRSTDRKTPSMESVDSSSEEELAIQRLEITKTDLHHRIAKEARANATLQASLERRKQALHERHLALEQDVARLQEQLQAERDLRVALEAGLSMTCKHYSGSHVTDSKTRAELEEIALAEADVARLKQKVADLHNQLNQQRQHHHVSLSDAYDHHQVQSHNSLQRYLQHDFNTSVAFRSHERKQRTEVTDHPRHQSAALVELTTRLDFFKERRSQLMEQLHNLDMAYGTASSQEFVYRPSSPPWN